MDFTTNTYRKLLETLIAKGYTFQTFPEFLLHPVQHCVILRHDVEAKYDHSLEFAKIQDKYQIQATYYFRFLPDHFDDHVIREIASLGHEIGYHYDDLSYCKGDYNAAIRRFEKNLATLNKISGVRTICMEGAPLSKFDNRDLWRKYNYRDYGIIGEPYFDLDFTKVFYLTDTGRRWDGGRFSIRDKVGGLTDKFQIPNSKFQTNSKSQILNSKQTKNSKLKTQNFSYHHTSDIITAANSGLLPDQIMLTFHPQRWTDKPLPWLEEFVLQNVKNVAKRWIVRGGKV